MSSVARQAEGLQRQATSRLQPICPRRPHESFLSKCSAMDPLLRIPNSCRRQQQQPPPPSGFSTKLCSFLLVIDLLPRMASSRLRRRYLSTLRRCSTSSSHHLHKKLIDCALKSCRPHLISSPSSSSTGGSLPHHSYCLRYHMLDDAQVVIFLGFSSLHTQAHSVSASYCSKEYDHSPSKRSNKEDGQQE